VLFPKYHQILQWTMVTSECTPNAPTATLALISLRPIMPEIN